MVRRGEGFYIYKVHLDFTSLLFSIVCWCLQSKVSLLRASTDAWFGPWGYYEFCFVAITVAEGWFAGLLTKKFSTVTRAIISTFTIVLVVYSTEAAEGTAKFEGGDVPCIMLLVIISLATLIFQTGRLNIMFILQSSGLATDPEEFFANPQASLSFQSPSFCRRLLASLQGMESLSLRSLRGYVVKYSVLIIFMPPTLAEHFLSRRPTARRILRRSRWS